MDKMNKIDRVGIVLRDPKFKIGKEIREAIKKGHKILLKADKDIEELNKKRSIKGLDLSIPFDV